MLLLLFLLGCIFAPSVVGDTYRHHHQTHHHHHRTQDITHQVRSGSRIREYCESGYWNARGNCADNIRVNWVVVDRPGDRRCHYVISGNTRDGRVYDATCEPRYFRDDFERAPISRHTYGDVYGSNPRDHHTATNRNERERGDPLYRNAPIASVVSALMFLAIRNFI